MQLTEVDLTSFTFGLCCTLITLWMWCAFSHFFKILSSLKEKVFYIKIAVVRDLPKCKILVETRKRYFVPYCSWSRSAWNNSLGVDLYCYVQINLQYLIISKIFYCLTYFSVKSCCTVFQWGAFKDMIYVCTYSRLFNTSQLMPSESVLLSEKTIKFGPVVELNSLGFHI